MEYEVLREFCEGCFRVSGIPIYIVENGELRDCVMYDDMPAPLDDITFTNDMKKWLREATSGPICAVTDIYLCYGYVKEAGSGFTLLIGPARLTEVSDMMVRETMITSKLPLSLFESVKKFLSRRPLVKYDNFVYLLSFINTSLNHVVSAVNTPVSLPFQRDDEKYTNHPDGNKLSEEKHTAELISRGLYSSITRGDTHALNRSWQRIIDSKGLHSSVYMVSDPFRQLKNDCVKMAALGAEAAIRGGVSPQVAYTISDIFIYQIEQSSEDSFVVKQLKQMLQQLCKTVKEKAGVLTDDPLTNRAAEYIDAHVREHLTLAGIARDIRVSSTYLSSRFAEKNGVTVNQYITRKKIEEAKLLLETTNYSLADISEYLSYSSQSHFQNRFKSVIGVTPGEYRQQHGEANNDNAKTF